MKYYSEQQLKDSLSGFKHSRYHMGENDLKTRYDNIELLLRDSKHVDMGLKLLADSGKSSAKSVPRGPSPGATEWEKLKAQAARDGFRGPEYNESAGAYREALGRHQNVLAKGAASNILGTQPPIKAMPASTQENCA